MGHHIDAEGRFQSDKYPELAPDKVVISLKDSRTWAGLRVIAVAYCTNSGADAREFGSDLFQRVKDLQAVATKELQRKGISVPNEDEDPRQAP